MKSSTLRHVFNFWPPFLFAGIHVTRMSVSYTHLDVYQRQGYADKTLMAGFTSVRDLGGGISPHLRDAVNQGLVKGPRI